MGKLLFGGGKGEENNGPQERKRPCFLPVDMSLSSFSHASPKDGKDGSSPKKKEEVEDKRVLFLFVFLFRERGRGKSVRTAMLRVRMHGHTHEGVEMRTMRGKSFLRRDLRFISVAVLSRVLRRALRAICTL